MFIQLWENKYNIARNFASLIFKNVYFYIILVLFILVIIYGWITYRQYVMNNITNKNEQPATEIFTSDELPPSFREAFVVPHPAPIFIQPASSPQLLLPYIKKVYLPKFNQINIQARGFDTLAELERTYNKMVDPITDTEQQYISAELKGIYNKYTSLYPAKIIAFINQIKLAKGAKWLEKGMPHTHDDVIIMNAKWFTVFNASTFIHELFHIIQRKAPELFVKLYTDWGFIATNNISGLNNEFIMSRLNPDGLDLNWIWHCEPENTYYWISAVYNSSAPTDLSDISIKAYPVVKLGDGRGNISFKYIGKTTVPVADLQVFKTHFGISPNHYNPNEICSQYAEDIFAGNDNKYPAFEIMRNWMANIG